MATKQFIIEGQVNVKVTVTEVDGNLEFKVEVLETDGKIAEINGFFFNFLGDCSTKGLKVEGDDVTGVGTNTLNLGTGVNMNGAVKSPYDIGVKLGTAGIGKDDIRTSTFTVDLKKDISIDDLDPASFGARLTSVGKEGGSREGSLKLVGGEEICPPCEEICTDFKIDFNEFEAGEVISELTIGADLTATVFGKRNTPNTDANDAMIFDTDNITGDDPDLKNGDRKVLILSEDNDSTDPDDAQQGGVFRFVFSDAVDLTSVVIIDTEAGGQIRAFDGGGGSLGFIAIPNVADGVVQLVDLSGFEGVVTLEVELNESGALDDLKLEYCRPDPTCSDCFHI